MNKVIRSIILLIAICSSAIYSSDNTNTSAVAVPSLMARAKNTASKIPHYLKQSGKYLFSTAGAKDLALAYCLGMGLTAIHELGHAVMAKIFYGSPINLVLGTMSRDHTKTYLKIGGIALGGFNPATGHATYFIPLNEYHPLKNAAISAAGPICGALSSLVAYLLLRKYKELYITKAAALYGLFNHTIGVAGVGGTWTPDTDTNHVVRSLREYYSQQ